ncbi:MAG: DinB family protein [Anaerolineae bacterium]
MLSIDTITMLWDYTHWANERLRQSLATISTQDFERDNPYGVGSLHQHAVHMMWAEALWLARLRESGAAFRWDVQKYPTLEVITARWQQVERDWRTYLSALSDDDLTRTFEAHATSGRFTHTIGTMLLHLVNHGTDHRAQMLRLIGDYGGQTFEQDLIYYLRHVSQ